MVWDNEKDKVAVSDLQKCVDLSFDDALDTGDRLNAGTLDEETVGLAASFSHSALLERGRIARRTAALRLPPGLSKSAARPVELLKIAREVRPFQAEHGLADSDFAGYVVANSGQRAQQDVRANRIHDTSKVAHRGSVGLEKRGVEIIRQPSALPSIGLKQEAI